MVVERFVVSKFTLVDWIHLFLRVRQSKKVRKLGFIPRLEKNEQNGTRGET